jgi:hypothetical protein
MPHDHFNLLHAKPAFDGDEPVRRSYAWVRGVFLTLTIVFAVLVVVSIPFIRAVQATYEHITDGRSELAAAQNSLATLNVDAALDHLGRAESEFSSARKRMVILHPFSILPFVGGYVSTAEDGLESGVYAVQAVREVLTALGEIVGVLQEGAELTGSVEGLLPDARALFRDITPARKRAVLAALQRNADKFADASTKIDSALVSFARIDETKFSAEVAASIAGIREQLLTLQGVFNALAPIAKNVPPLLGYPEEKRYLIFFQNNTELRPTGGFLGVYGAIVVKDAELVSVHTDDIYALDGPAESTERPDAPPPIRRYIGIDSWYLRDANWSPDFPTAAAIMERFYREEALVAEPDAAALPIDGIIATTPRLASDLLRLTGPITVDDVTFTSENLVDELEFQVERNFVNTGVAFGDRKDIIGKLLDGMIDRITALPMERILEAVGMVHASLEESDILLAMKDPDLQAVVFENDWGGKLHAPDSDYFTVVDANLASLKSDPAVRRDIAYSISPSPEGYVASVRITYDHRGTFDWKTTRYRTYTRILVPLGATLLGVDGALVNDRLKDPAQRSGTPDVFEEAGKQAFGAFISIEPQRTGVLEFRYLLPGSVTRSIEAGEYGLYVEKQPGTEANGLTLDLDFGKTLRSAAPAEPSERFGDTRYSYATDLRVDREFLVDLAE